MSRLTRREWNKLALGNIALRSNAKITWDGQREQIVGNVAASKLLRKEYRNSWKLT